MTKDNTYMEDWMWKNRKMSLDLVEDIDITATTVSTIRNNKRTPELLTALKLQAYSENLDQPLILVELLNSTDRKKYNDWLSAHSRKLQQYHEIDKKKGK